MKSTRLRLPCQEGTCGGGGQALKNLRITVVLHCYSTTSFVQRSGDGDAESLLVLTPIMPPPAAYFISVISL
jgi:hypothetical protein